ncbi:metallophosphoesterase [Bacillus testis]|uniref:metallophosphoesterase n=1 Tax=Bacillus testis TaxID=1622072 RepID=UPI0009E36A7E|nr:metallophosphoesterase [Bacillus testis]
MEYILWSAVAIVAAGLAGCLYMWRLAYENNVMEHSFSFMDFPAGFGTVSLFFISDIHKRSIHDSIIKSAKGKAECVIIGGDLAEGGVPFSLIEENIRKLKSIGPVYFVWGNNDYELDYHELDALLLSLGVKILDNTSVTFESPTGDKMSLLGVDYCDGGKARLDLALQDSEEGTFKILASHSPSIMRKVDPAHGISFILAGHTHGGQIRLFGFGRYAHGGVTVKGNTTMFTSNGYGTSVLPLRLGAKAQTHIIHLSRCN